MDKETILLQLNDFMKNNNFSEGEIARMIGISGSALNQARKGKYVGDVERILKKIDAFLKAQEIRAEGPRELKFVMTKNARAVFDVAQYAMTFGSMCVITGRAGLGKTKALTEFAALTENVYYIRVNNTYMVKTLLREIARRIGLSSTGSNNSLYNNIVQRVRRSNRLLLFDESHKLEYRCLELIRDVYDDTGIGVVLAGDSALYDRITGRYNFRYDRNFDQLYSRIRMYRNLESLTVADVKLMLQTIFPGVDDKLANYALNITGGNARNLSNCAVFLQLKGYKEISKRHFEEASKYQILAA